MSFRKSVPPLSSLVSLDAAVRHRSFTLAARELGVTQAAVSRQIAALETDLGEPLFLRRHRSIEPTAACLRLADALHRHFTGIADSVSEFRASAADGAITVAATPAFSQLWLLPRLVQFRRDHPDARIWVNARDEAVDLENESTDLAIRYGTGPFSDGRIVASRSDILFPVSSPDYATRLGDKEGRFWEGHYDLIRNEQTNPAWYSWQDWFAGVGLKHRMLAPTLSFNHFTDVLYAARAGQGIALGWEVLVQTFLHDGTLVRLGETSMPAAGQFHAVVSHRARASPTLDRFVEWITRELCREDDPASPRRKD